MITVETEQDFTYFEQQFAQGEEHDFSYFEQQFAHEHEQQPPVIEVAGMLEDELVRRTADRFIRFAGSTALGNEVEDAERFTGGRSQNLQEAIQNAAWGDQEAKSLIRANVATDTIERIYKSGHVIDVRLTVDESDRLSQHGQTMDAVHANSLRYASANPEMQARSQAEARNKFRIENLIQSGSLEDYWFVTISRCEEKDDDWLKANGFFEETKSTSLQATTMDNGEIIMQSAFMAGVREFGGPRHDKETVVGLGAQLDVDYRDMAPAEIIDKPILVHKSLMPNGVIDLVELSDGDSFFGENKPKQDYLAYLDVCRQREADFEPLVDEITNQLIAEADSISTPLEAVERLHQLSQEHTLKRAIEDETINPRVFGPTAAGHIEQARLHRQLGNTELANAAERKAQSSAESSSCPAAFKQKEIEEGSQKSENSDKPESKESKTGKIRCINCREYVPKSQVVKEDCWECPRCRHKVDICDGKVLRQGDTKQTQENEEALVIDLGEKRKEKVQVAETTASQPDMQEPQTNKRAA